MSPLDAYPEAYKATLFFVYESARACTHTRTPRVAGTNVGDSMAFSMAEIASAKGGADPGCIAPARNLRLYSSEAIGGTYRYPTIVETAAILQYACPAPWNPIS